MIPGCGVGLAIGLSPRCNPRRFSGPQSALPSLVHSRRIRAAILRKFAFCGRLTAYSFIDLKPMDFLKKLFESVYLWITSTIVNFWRSLNMSMRLPVIGPQAMLRLRTEKETRGIDPIFALFLAAAILMSIVLQFDIERDDWLKPIREGKAGPKLYMVVVSAFVFCALVTMSLYVLRIIARFPELKRRAQTPSTPMTWRAVRRGAFFFGRDSAFVRRRLQALPLTIVAALGWIVVISAITLIAPEPFIFLLGTVPAKIQNWGSYELFTVNLPLSFNDSIEVRYTVGLLLSIIYTGVLFIPVFWASARLLMYPDRIIRELGLKEQLRILPMAVAIFIVVSFSMLGATMSYSIVRGPTIWEEVKLTNPICDLRFWPDIRATATIKNGYNTPLIIDESSFDFGVVASAEDINGVPSLDVLVRETTAMLHLPGYPLREAWDSSYVIPAKGEAVATFDVALTADALWVPPDNEAARITCTLESSGIGAFYVGGADPLISEEFDLTYRPRPR